MLPMLHNILLNTIYQRIYLYRLAYKYRRKDLLQVSLAHYLILYNTRHAFDKNFRKKYNVVVLKIMLVVSKIHLFPLEEH